MRKSPTQALRDPGATVTMLAGAPHAVQRATHLALAACAAALLLSACGASRERTLARFDASMKSGDYRAAVIDAQTLIRSDPNNMSFRMRYADALLGVRRYSDAAIELRKAQKLGATASEVTPRLLEALVGQQDFAGAVALAPDATLLQQPKTLRVWAEALLGVDRTDEARQALAKVIALSPRDARAHVDMASVDVRAQDQTGVKSELDTALELGGNDYLVQAAVGGWYARGGNLPTAREHFSKAATIAHNAKDKPEEATALVNLADVTLAQGDLAAAQDTLKRLELLLPTSEPTLLLKARVALRGARPGEAEAPLDKLLATNPHSAAGNFLLGALKAQQGYLSEAQTYLSAATAANPQDAQARRLLADVELRQGRAREVLALVGAASESKDSDLLALAGRASLSAGDPAAAIEYFERSRDIAGSDTARSLDLAAAYIAANRGADAVTLLRKTTVTGELANRQETLLATALAQTGQQAAAAAEAREFAKIRPTDALALVAAGRGLWAAGELSEARGILLQATRVNPKEREAWSALGMLALAQGDKDAATSSFDQVLRLHPDDVDAFVGKARIALKDGKKDEAIRQLEAARHAQPTALGPGIDLARLYLAANDQPHLSQVLTELRQLAPQDMQVRALEAEKALALHQAPEAIAAYQALIVDFPNVSAFHADLAQAYLAAGQLSDARRANLDALKLNPNYWAGDVFEASVALTQNLLPEAGQAIAHLKARPGIPKALVAVLQGDLEMHKSEFAQAAQDYTAAYAERPTSLISLKEYAALRAIHSPSREGPLRDWLQRSPEDVSVRLALGQDLQASGDNDAAMQQYALVVQHHPDNVPALNNLAWLKVQAGATAEALTLAQHAYEHDSHSAAVADTYGWTLVQSNRVPEALPVLRAAHSAAPDQPDIRYHLAVALARSSLQPEARQELQAIVGPDTHFPEQDAARSLLKSLTAPRS